MCDHLYSIYKLSFLEYRTKFPRSYKNIILSTIKFFKNIIIKKNFIKLIITKAKLIGWVYKNM